MHRGAAGLVTAARWDAVSPASSAVTSIGATVRNGAGDAHRAAEPTGSANQRGYAADVPYPADNLHSNEELVLDLHPHWWTVTPAFLSLLAAVAFGIFALSLDGTGFGTQSLSVAAAIAILATLVWFGIRLLQLRFTNFVLTSDRVIYRRGIISKTGIEIPLDSINAIHFSQRFWERMLGLGDLRIDSASIAGQSEFENIRHPNQVQNQIYLEMESNENRKFDRLGGHVDTAMNAMAQQHAAQTPQPTVPEQLEHLSRLRDQGILTEEEFAAKKTELLGRM